MPKNSIYITGWEYNRLLAEHWAEPVQSALPGAVLWNGGSQFWLFENVYCTKESLDCEIHASEVIGYGQGKIFKDLRDSGFLKAFDWKALNTDTIEGRQLAQRHQILRETHDKTKLLDLLNKGEAEALEALKLQLMEPILKKLNCIGDVTANSIEYWMRLQSKKTPQTEMTRALDLIARPIMESQETVPGMTICEYPGSRATLEQITQQKDVEREFEKPLIPKVMSNDLSLNAFLEAQLPYKEVYRPISEQMIEDWQRSYETLQKLRDIAQKHLWKDLHGDWLPRLEAEPAFLSEFKSLLKDALLRAKVGEILNKGIQVAIIAVSLKVGLVGAALGGPTVGLGAGQATKQFLDGAHKGRMKETDNLALFYQGVKRMKSKFS